MTEAALVVPVVARHVTEAYVRAFLVSSFVSQLAPCDCCAATRRFKTGHSIEQPARWRRSARLGDRFDGFPIEVGIASRPRVNFGLTNLTAEATARLLGARLLSSLISGAALRADEYHGDRWVHSQSRIGAIWNLGETTDTALRNLVTVCRTRKPTRPSSWFVGLPLTSPFKTNSFMLCP
jgi:hypothetical protein